MIGLRRSWEQVCESVEMALACCPKEGAERGLRVSARPVSSGCHDPLAEAGPRACGSRWLRGLCGRSRGRLGAGCMGRRGTASLPPPGLLPDRWPHTRRHGGRSRPQLSERMTVRGLFEAYDRDAWLPILLDGDGLVSEGAGFNVFAIVDGELLAPPAACWRGSLEGPHRDRPRPRMARADRSHTRERALPRAGDLPHQRRRRCDASRNARR